MIHIEWFSFSEFGFLSFKFSVCAPLSWTNGPPWSLSRSGVAREYSAQQRIPCSVCRGIVIPLHCRVNASTKVPTRVCAEPDRQALRDPRNGDRMAREETAYARGSGDFTEKPHARRRLTRVHSDLTKPKSNLTQHISPRPGVRLIVLR